MASSLAQTTAFSFTLLITTTLLASLTNASEYRTYHGGQTTPSLPSYVANTFYPPAQVYEEEQPPYYTQSSNPPPPSYGGYTTQPSNPPPPSYDGYTTQPSNPPPQPPSYGGYSGDSSDKAAFLKTHNDARRSVGLSPYTWDDSLAAYAQNWANQRINDCRLVHSGSPDYGENIFWGSGDYSAAFAVQTWVDEGKYYNVNTNSCSGGMDCGHWTQIVWRDSTRLGCARVKCSNGGVFVTCNYDPPGNYIGTRPY